MDDKELKEIAWQYVKGTINPMSPKHEGLIAIEAFIAGANWKDQMLAAKAKDENENRNLS